MWCGLTEENLISQWNQYLMRQRATAFSEQVHALVRTHSVGTEVAQELLVKRVSEGRTDLWGVSGKGRGLGRARGNAPFTIGVTHLEG